jgi:type I restriction enzyme S subunit
MAGKLVPLSQIADIVGGFAFKGEDFSGIGYPVVKIANIQPPTVNLKDSVHIPAEKVGGLERFRLQNRDIVMAMTGATIGKVGRIRSAEVSYLNQRVAKISAKAGRALDNFIFALVSQSGFDERVTNNSNGSAQSNISAEAIGRILVPDIAPNEQLQIGRIIGALDDKIELNRRVNETLEAMAQALFQSWFVDFDPVHAKLKGRRPIGLDSETAALFPSSFQDSPMGDIPNGWQVTTIADTCGNIFSGGTPSTKTAHYWGGNISWLSSGETRSRFIIETEKLITKAGVENSSTRLASSGCTVIASAGQGHTRGQTSLLTFESYINQSVVALAANPEVTSDLFLFFDLARRYEEFRQLSDSHSSRGSLTTKIIGGVKAALPTRELISCFDRATGPAVAQITANLRQSRTLAALRDTLLPKLLSGELSVAATEKLMGACL